MKNLRKLLVTVGLGVLLYILGYHWVTNLGIILLLLLSLIIVIPTYVRGKRIVKERKVLGMLMMIFSVASFTMIGIFIVTTLLSMFKGRI